MRSTSGDLPATFTYVAAPEAIRDDLTSYRWCRDTVIQGAIQDDLPESDVREIEAAKTVEDPGR
jgi:hypothetical protein